jgi:hypothetical protein
VSQLQEEMAADFPSAPDVISSSPASKGRTFSGELVARKFRPCEITLKMLKYGLRVVVSQLQELLSTISKVLCVV